MQRFFSFNSRKSNTLLTQRFSLKKYKAYSKLLTLSHVITPLLIIATITFTFRGNIQSSNYLPIGDSVLTSIISDKEISRISQFSTIETTKDLQNLDKDSELSFAFYRVQPGDNISSIAQKFKISIGTILSLNSFDNAHSLSVGQKVLLTTKSGILVNVSTNESLADITKRYGVSKEETFALNNLKTDELSMGQTIFLPGANFSFKQMSKLLGIDFINPIPGHRRLSSHFGWRRHPVLGYRKLHNGTDFAARVGTTVIAAKEGRVIQAGWNGGYGLFIKIRHNNGYTTSYAHLSKIRVKQGQWVSTGQAIAASGNTGLSTGPHLHFELRKYGQPLNAIAHGVPAR